MCFFIFDVSHTTCLVRINSLEIILQICSTKHIIYILHVGWTASWKLAKKWEIFSALAIFRDDCTIKISTHPCSYKIRYTFITTLKI